jgi:plasmid stabilization system protein ParE
VTYRVLLRKEAQDDLKDAAAWYEEQRHGLGGEFLDEAASTLNRIGGTPFAYADVHRGVRRALLRRFPFALYFRVESEVVSVLAVMHGSRSPTAWQVRT